MAYYGLVTRICNLKKAPNSDRLWVGQCFNENVIVGPNLSEGDLVLYLPAGGKIERWFGNAFNLFKYNEDGTLQGGFIGNNSHIKAIKLRGNQSCGVVISLARVYQEFGNQHWVDGDKVNEINGKPFCYKYIPTQKFKNYGPKPTSLKGKKTPKYVYPDFAMHVDTEQLAYNLDKFHEGDQINITLKLHGTSQRSAHTCALARKGFFRKLFHLPPKKKYQYMLGTRRCVIHENSVGYYGNDQFRYPHHEKLIPFLEKDMEVFAEIVGWYGSGLTDTIMPICDNSKLHDEEFIKKYGPKTIFSYGCSPGQSQMYIYRITSENGKKEWTPDEITEWCDKHGFNRVPVVENFTFTTAEDLMERINNYLADLQDPIGKTHIKEGVVVRIVNRPTFTAFKYKPIEFKILSGIAAESANTNLSEDILSEI